MDDASNWLSTLGGAYSNLGDHSAEYVSQTKVNLTQQLTSLIYFLGLESRSQRDAPAETGPDLPQPRGHPQVLALHRHELHPTAQLWAGAQFDRERFRRQQGERVH